jgi:hypothetical protein
LKSVKISLFLLVAALAWIAMPAHAQTTYYVSPSGDDATGDGSAGNPYRTIQFVYENISVDGDTIRALPGTYDECGVLVAALFVPPVGTDFDGKPVEIVADAFEQSGDSTATILEKDPVLCSSGQPEIVIGHRTTLRGFTIRGGGASGILTRGSATVTNNIIENNTSTSGGGIFVYTANCYYGDTQVDISDNIIRNNDAEFADGDTESGSGGGVYVTAQALTLECGTLPNEGSPQVTIENNVIENNTAEIAGGGVYAFTNTTSPAFPATVTVTNNTIDGNLAGIVGAAGAGGTGGGIFVTTFGYYTEDIVLSDNDIRVNTATGSGGGLTAQIDSLVLGDHSVTVNDNVLTGNTAEADGGGMNLFLYAQDLDAAQSLEFSVEHNTATGNMCSGVSAGGGGLVGIFQSIRSAATGMSFSIEGNRLTDNVAEVVGGGASLLVSAESDDASLPVPDGMLSPATATIDFKNNLVARNDAIDMGGGAGGGAGGGVFTFLLSFGEATATTNITLDTIVENTNELGSGGVEIEVYTGLDNQGMDEGLAVVTLTDSIVADNVGFGIGGPFPGGGTSNLNLNTIEYSDLYNNTDVLTSGNPVQNYEGWVNDRTGFFGNISEDPMLTAFPAYKPMECSPVLDAADPATDFSLEPKPDGNRANMGHLGGTDSLPGANAAASDVTSLPDPSGDGRIDGVDVLRISTSFGATSGAARYLPEADLDGVCSVGAIPCVDGNDLALVTSIYGQSCDAAK